MELQGRELTVGMQGDDVRLLHTELRILAFRIAESERADAAFGGSTTEAVGTFQGAEGLPVTGVVDKETAARINVRVDERTPPVREFVVRGTVMRPDGRPAEGASVVAFDRDLRLVENLGEASTKADGSYLIGYTSASFATAEKGSADLLIRAATPDGGSARSRVVFNAGPDEVVDLTLDGAPPSEFETLVADVTPLLRDMSLADLLEDDQHDDISFLAGDTGHDVVRVSYLVLAHRDARSSEVAPAAFYGLFRQGMPTDFAALTKQPAVALAAALRQSLHANIIPAGFADQVDQQVLLLVGAGVHDVLRGPDGAPTPIGAVVSVALPDDGLAHTFLRAYVDHTGDRHRFWTDLAKRPEFSAPGLVSNLQLSLQLGALTQNHGPLTQQLYSSIKRGVVPAVRDLATFDAAKWERLATSAGGAPPGIPGQTPAERTKRYAVLLEAIAGDAFPTTALTSRLALDPVLSQGAATKFLTANPDLDLGTMTVDAVVAENRPGATDRDSLAVELKGVQRLFRLAPRFPEIRELLKDKVDSAHAITRTGQNAFVNTYGPRMGSGRAAVVYERAQQVTATALVLLARLAPAFRSVGMRVLPVQDPFVQGVNTSSVALAPAQPQQSSQAVPNWETLFGSVDFCECSQCGSVYSPAAYLADLLTFLRYRKAQPPAAATVKDMLFARRPDLGEIELSCANTNIPVPYVDLVNEVLANAIEPQSARDRQTGGTALERAANPEHTNSKAYTKLGNGTAVYPFELPFDVWLDEARSYLGHLGGQRHELMVSLGGLAPTDSTVAIEHLGLNPVQAAVIAGTWSPAQPHEFFGLSSAGTWVADLRPVRALMQAAGLSYPELTQLLTMRFVNPTGNLVIGAVTGADPATCDTTKLQIATLDGAALDRIHRFVRLWRGFGGPMRELDRAIAALSPGSLDTDFLVKLSLVRRLTAEFNLSMEQVLACYAPIDTYRYGDGDEDRPPYERTFLDPAVITLAPGDPSDFALKPDGSDVLSPSNLTDHGPALLAALSIGEPDLAALLSGPYAVVPANPKLNRANLTRLARTVTLARALDLPVPDLLRLLVISDTKPFVDTGPVTPANLQATRDFGTSTRKLADTTLTLAETEAVLWPERPQSPPVLPADDKLAAILTDLRAGLQAIVDDTSDTSDEKGDLTRKQLALLRWEPALVEQATATLLGNITYSASLAAMPTGVTVPDTLATRFRYDDEAKAAIFAGPMTTAEQTLLAGLSTDGDYTAAIDELYHAPRRSVAQRMGSFPVPTFTTPLDVLPAGVVIPTGLRRKVFHDPAARQLICVGYLTDTERAQLRALSDDAGYVAATEALYTAPASQSPAPGTAFLTSADVAALFDTATTVAKRLAFILGKLQPYLRRTLSEDVARTRIGAAAGLDPASGEALLAALRSTTNTGQPLLADFLDTRFAASDPAVRLTRAAFPAQFAALSEVHRVALLVTRLRVTPAQQAWLYRYPNASGWYDPTRPPSDPGDRWRAWLRLVDPLRLRNALPDGARTVDRVLRMVDAKASGADVLAALRQQTSWNGADLAFLTGPSGLNLTLPGALADERELARLATCFTALGRLGVTAERARAWALQQPGELTSRSIRQAVRGRYDADTWAAVARPLRDPLRERLRIALAAYLLHPVNAAGRWRDLDEMYEYFLIDVQMGACMTTSRIKQAISSVQLFVQRCLLNLEPVVTASSQADSHWDEWEWMKQYRVWEANRKIFLYPENWLTELPDEMTPLFTELDNDLLQSDITADSAEEAYRRYLTKLDDIARLEVKGVYHDTEHDVRHVIARTKNTPAIYYHRTFVNGSRWTPWIRMDVEIEGNHIIPVVWNRRLHVFWPVFTKVQQPQPLKFEQGKTVPDPTFRSRIQLAWSEHKNDTWLPKKLSSAFLDSREYEGTPATDRFVFRADTDSKDGDLRILCHESDKAERAVLFGWFGLESANSAVRSRAESWVKPRGVIGPQDTMVSNTAFEELMTMAAPTPGVPLPHQGILYVAIGNVPRDTPVEEVKSYTAQVDLLRDTPSAAPFRIVYPHQYEQFTAQDAFFIGEGNRTFQAVPHEVFMPTVWARPELVGMVVDDKLQTYYSNQPWFDGGNGSTWLSIRAPVAGATATTLGLTLPTIDSLKSASDAIVIQYPKETRFALTAFYHPYAGLFLRELNRFGLPGILNRSIQVTPETLLPPLDFVNVYHPTSAVDQYPAEDVDFAYAGPYAQYNWELFFHAPLLVAARLSKNQRFAEAQRWFHTILDPTDTSDHTTPQKYWRTKPFFQRSSADYERLEIQKLLNRLAAGQPDPDLDHAVSEWRRNPFNPHLVARLRTTAYQKAVVMAYLDNLIAWGDQAFHRDTIESINEATQLYVLAAQILGPRPIETQPRVVSPPTTYNEMEPKLDDFSNKLVGAENLVPVGSGAQPRSNGQPSLTLLTMLFFCIPPNDKLLGYWDLVADRLFKIRHCMNLEGVSRTLDLFEPAIDPGVLARAAAAGVDLGAALADVDAPTPGYRFTTMAGKAAELAGQVQSLGAALLSALEKRDAEALGLLRSSHELAVLDAVRDVKVKQHVEAGHAKASLEEAKKLAEIKQQYYTSREYMNVGEAMHLALHGGMLVAQSFVPVSYLLAAALSLIPNFKIGAPTSLGVTFGGHNVEKAADKFALLAQALVGPMQTGATMAAALGGYARRNDDWNHQTELAAAEIVQIGKQLAGADVRSAIAQKEIDNHDLQTRNTRAVDDFLHDKFTSRELYDRLVGQLSAVYFQAYQLAYDVAKRAEQAFRRELGIDDTRFIQFGYWDSLKKGLLAGELLLADIRRMEAAYLDQNKREYELTKHVSLAMLDPQALVSLKQTGSCFLAIPETLYDIDCPGHYHRRLKSVSLSIPCVAGPYTSVNATLTLAGSSVRISPTLLSGKYGRQSNDPRFRDYRGVVQSVVTSTGREDPGLFETNLRDERFLPFEHSGAVSEWRIELPAKFHQFDYDTITDVVLHLRYTARDGGAALRGPVLDELKAAVDKQLVGEGRRGLFRMFGARHELPDAWQRFLSPAGDADHELVLDLSKNRFPHLVRDRDIKIDKVRLVLVLSDARVPGQPGKSFADVYAKATSLKITLTPPGTIDKNGKLIVNDKSGELVSNPVFLDGAPNLEVDTDVNPDAGANEWRLKAARADVARIAEAIRNAT